MKIKPLRGKVLIEVTGNEPETSGKIYLAKTLKEIPTRGICVAIGKPPRDKKGREIAWGMEVGKQIHFKRRFGTPYEPLQGKRQLFLKWEEIVGVSDEN